MKAARLSFISPLLILFLCIPAGALEEGYGRTMEPLVFAAGGAIDVDADGALFYAHDSEPDYLPEKIYKHDVNSGGADHLFADEFGSVATIVIDEAAGVLFVGDNAVGARGVGDSIFRVEDLNGDGDALDEGEVVLYAPDGAIPFISGMGMAVSGELYAANAEGDQGDLFRVVDLNGDGDALDPDEVTVWATDIEVMFLAGVEAVEGPDRGVVVWVNDASGDVFRLEDLNGDGDADDEGELTSAATGLPGGYDLALDMEGDLFVSAGTALYRLSGGEAVLFDDLSDTAGFLTGVAFDTRQRPFEPYAAGGAHLYLAYLDTSWGNPAEVFAYAPEPMATATPLPSATPEPTATMPPTTATPVPTATEAPDTATPVASATPEPTSTAIPPLGVYLEMPAHEFAPGDPCGLEAEVCNPGDDLGEHPLFVLLDVGTGDYWFWPGWVHYPPEIDYGTVTLDAGCQVVTVIPPFEWPAGVGAASGLYFHGALLTPEMNEILGEMSSWEFAYSE
jgi:hypothetical protein